MRICAPASTARRVRAARAAGGMGLGRLTGDISLGVNTPPLIGDLRGARTGSGWLRRGLGPIPGESGRRSGSYLGRQGGSGARAARIRSLGVKSGGSGLGAGRRARPAPAPALRDRRPSDRRLQRRTAAPSFSIRIAVALNSAVPDFGSVASIVSRLTGTSSWKWRVMNARPGRRDGSARTGASTEPRRETTRTTSPSASAEPLEVLRAQVERLAAPPGRAHAAGLDAGVVRVQVAAGREPHRELGGEEVDRPLVLHRPRTAPATRAPDPPTGASGGTARRGGSRRSRATGARPRPRGARSSCPAWTGDRARSSFQTASAEASPQSWPIRRAISKMIHRSSRASPGGSSALRTRWTRRSELVTVPSVSAQAAAAGSTTSAISAVFVRKMSCTTRNSRPARSRRARCVSASDWAGFSPMQYTAVRSPRSIASYIAVRFRPRFGGIVTPQAASKARPQLVVLHVLEARQPIRERAHVAAALDVVLAAERVEAAAPPAHVPAQQREVDQRQDVVDRVVVLGDAQGPADHRPLGGRVGVGGLPDRRRGDAGHALRALERPRLHGCPVRLEPAGGAPDELLVREARGDDLAAHGVRQRDVGAHVQAQPQVGPLRGRGAARDPRRTAGRRCAPP